MSFFKGTDDKYSMMRLLCFIATLGTLPVFYFQPDQSEWASAVLIVALAGKWLQKRVE